MKDVERQQMSTYHRKVFQSSEICTNISKEYIHVHTHPCCQCGGIWHEVKTLSVHMSPGVHRQSWGMRLYSSLCCGINVTLPKPHTCHKSDADVMCQVLATRFPISHQIVFHKSQLHQPAALDSSTCSLPPNLALAVFCKTSLRIFHFQLRYLSYAQCM